MPALHWKYIYLLYLYLIIRTYQMNISQVVDQVFAPMLGGLLIARQLLLSEEIPQVLNLGFTLPLQLSPPGTHLLLPVRRGHRHLQSQNRSG